ncbi:MAG: hypothetical protein U0166_12180 [Acidobacteriota bacterium]
MRLHGPALALVLAASPALASSFVVHEWGTFTTIAGPDGKPVLWRPLAGHDDLPAFVHRIDRLPQGLRAGLPSKLQRTAQVRMETPVIYFYGDREMTASVRVLFPSGQITEWYPEAETVAGGVIDWGRFAIVPGAEIAPPVEEAPSHYYAARDVDAAPVRVCGQAGIETDRFLFYRGVGDFTPAVTARLDGTRVVIDNTGASGVQVILFENRGGRVGFRSDRMVVSSVTMDRPELTAAAGDLEGIAAELVRVLTSEGLYEKEARAMVATWRDSWFEPGLRVFAVLPRSATDEVLPLTVDPRPDDVVRVMVGRTELITPEMESAVRKAVASGAPLPFGRFAEPILREIAAGRPDPKVKERLEVLLASPDARAELQ